MNYFAYLYLTQQKDNKDTYIKFLVEIMDYSKESAKKNASLFYNEDGTLRETLF